MRNFKNFICFFAFCCLAAVAGHAQTLVKEKEFGMHTEPYFSYKIQNFDKLYDEKKWGYVDMSRERYYKLGRELFQQIVTPDMMAILKKVPLIKRDEQSQKYIKADYKIEAYEGHLIVNFYFDKTGKIITVSFIINGKFIDTFTEKRLKELYRRCLAAKIDMTGIKFEQGTIAIFQINDLVRFAKKEN